MVLERFTVDVLAEKVATQLLEGDPSAKLAHRFFRKGRRDGRKGYEHGSVSKMLIDAVQLAASTLVEDLTATRRQTALRIAVCEATIEEDQALRETQNVADQPEVPATSFDPPRSAGSEHRDSAQLLTDALTSRQALKSRREAQAAASQALERQRARASALDAAASAAARAKAEISKLRSDLLELPSEYAQRFESIRHTGELLWSRYCNGFVQGEAKRGARGSDLEPPTGSLQFTTPAALDGSES